MSYRTQLGVVFNLAVTISIFCIGLIVPWALYNEPVESLPASTEIYEEKTVGIWRCYDKSCTLSSQPRFFFWAAIFALVLLCMSVVLALASVMAEASRGIDILPESRHALRLHLSAFLCLLGAPLMYILISFRGLRGGHYMVGVWMTFIAAAISGILLAIEYFWAPQAQYTAIRSGPDTKRGDAISLRV